MLVALVMAGCLAAVYKRAGWAGFCLGLAIATKQQGLFFVPLTMALLMVRVRDQELGARNRRSVVTGNTSHVSRITYHVSRFTIVLLLTLLPAFIWDFTRNQPSAFLEQSLSNYGGLTAGVAGFGERWLDFVELLQYATDSPILNTIFLVGCPLLLIYGAWQMWKTPPTHQVPKLPNIRQAQTDWLLFLFSLAFLLLHTLLSFQVWDRYLLGLIPLLALLLARVLLLPWSMLKSHWFGIRPDLFPATGLIIGLGLLVLLGLTLTNPVQAAVHAGYPLGSNSNALRGIEQITAYLQGHVGANNTLYHHWLGTHWRFYLWDYPYDLQYWASPRELAVEARPGHLIASPSWRSDTEVRLALFKVGLNLRELTRAYTPGGYPSIILYRIEAIP
jgi:hypothetical protein